MTDRDSSEPVANRAEPATALTEYIADRMAEVDE
jgi:hypothetical protein